MKFHFDVPDLCLAVGFFAILFFISPYIKADFSASSDSQIGTAASAFNTGVTMNQGDSKLNSGSSPSSKSVLSPGATTNQGTSKFNYGVAPNSKGASTNSGNVGSPSGNVGSPDPKYDSILPEAVINDVFYSKKEESKYSCATKDDKGSNVWCLQFVFKSTDSSWQLFPNDTFQIQQFFGLIGSEDFNKTIVTVTSPRYRSVKSTVTEKYHIAFTGEDPKKTGGSVSKVSEPDKIENTQSDYTNPKTKAPPDIPKDTVVGIFKKTFKSGTGSSQIIEDFSVQENSRSQLLFNGPQRKYKIVVGASVHSITLNQQRNLLENKEIPCSLITIAGKVLDKSCQTTLVVQGPIATVDVTPKTTSTAYYKYSVSIVASPFPL